MSKKKQTILSVIGVLVLVVAVFGVSVAFFNYTRTGAANTVSVGRISFATRQTKTISLTNLFPIDPTDTEAMADATKVGTVEIEIEGDTDYIDGVEYLVSSENTHITTSSGKVVPISLDVSISNLGTASPNYFTAREDKNATIYKKLVGDELVGDQMLFVGYIKPNTTSGQAEGVNGKLTIKAYLDENKIAITDTYDGTESDNMGTTNNWVGNRTVFTTTEWNALKTSGISFKVKVEANEGIWVKGSLDEIMRAENRNSSGNPIMDNVASDFVTASTGINFGAISSDTNGKGVYMRAGTQGETYPIVYYRGAVDNNNVMFNNKCWKAVRTTDTGGVKLIYNGTPANIYRGLGQSDYNVLTNTNDLFSYDDTTTVWNGTSTSAGMVEFEFTVPNASDYIFDVTVTTGSTSGGSLNVYKNETNVYNVTNGGGAVLSYSYNAGSLTNSDKIKFSFNGSGTSVASPLVYKLKMYKQSSDILGQNCDNAGTDTQITLNGTGSFQFSGNNLYYSPAYVGYMWGTVYPYSTSNWTSNAKFGSSFTWDGTNYKLVDATVTTPNDTHHYSCNQADAEATCASIRYVYWLSGSTKYYITISDGKGIEEAIEDMQTNTNPSNAKTQIDSWYASNMNTVTNKLEDTIWCNDRSIGRYNGWSATGTINGSSDYKNYSLLFGAHERSNHASGTSTTKNQPSLACVNKNDAFTVNNGNGNQKLQYPVALLTEDEIVLAGGLAGTQNTSFYLNNGNTYYWSLSPSYFYFTYAREFYVNRNGNLNYDSVNGSFGLRPVVSLKLGTPVKSGDGTATSPYKIES